jgi:hypothetical protein
MTTLLYLAAFLAIAIGIAHSYLGERYILVRLLRRPDLPKLFGGTEFTTRTLRFAWHITSIAWWGFAALLILLAHQPLSSRGVGLVVGVTFLATSAVALVGSRGRHLSWLVFLAIGMIAIYAAGT